MAQLSYTYTLTGGQTALASQVQGNFTSVATIINGQLNSDNFASITGVLTWAVVSTTALCQSISTASVNGAIKITETGVLDASKSCLWVTSSAAQTTGDALVFIEQSSSSSTIPALKVSTSVAEMLAVRKAGTTLRRPSAAKTTTYTVLTTDDILTVDGTSAFTVTLPTMAASLAGFHVTLIRIDQTLANAVTIDTPGAETINGAAQFKLMTQYEKVTLYADGTNWHILEHTYPSKWTAYTPVGTWIAGTEVYTGFWRRVGDSIEVDITVAPGGAPTATTLTVDLPVGLTAATAKMSSTEFGKTLGISTIRDDSASAYIGGQVFYTDSNSISPRWGYDTGAGAGYIAQEATTATSPVTFANGDKVHLRAMLPITNWEP